MKFPNPFSTLSKFEWALWIGSLVVITVSFLIGANSGLLILIASLIGATALIFVSKGNVFGQVLTVVFSLLYAVISLEFRYFGEMITYLGMTSPIAVLSIIEWLKHPYESGKAEVEVSKLDRRKTIWMIILAVVVTAIFYFILKAFHTTNLIISTVSVTTSFLASYLMLFRSPTYALAYAANDVVLIILWVLASIESISYLPMVICFLVFLMNDSYGFYNWTRIRRRQVLSKVEM